MEMSCVPYPIAQCLCSAAWYSHTAAIPSGSDHDSLMTPKHRNKPRDFSRQAEKQPDWCLLRSPTRRAAGVVGDSGQTSQFQRVSHVFFTDRHFLRNQFICKRTKAMWNKSTFALLLQRWLSLDYANVPLLCHNGLRSAFGLEICRSTF